MIILLYWTWPVYERYISSKYAWDFRFCQANAETKSSRSKKLEQHKAVRLQRCLLCKNAVIRICDELY